MKIAVTYTSNIENYQQWLEAISGVETICFKSGEINTDTLNNCNGLVLTGGVDTHPKFYNNSKLDYANAPLQFDVARDVFELELFEKARILNLPTLGICRGFQLINIACGGGIIQDLEENGFGNHRKNEEKDQSHAIHLNNKDSALFSIVNILQGQVNSAHHQGVVQLGQGLKATSISNDGIIESMEWENKPNHWMQAVQWHPERMIDQNENPFSFQLRKAFIDACDKHQTINSRV